MRRSATLVVVVLSFAQLSCGVFGEDAVLELSTDQEVYPRGSKIHVTGKNISRDVIYYNSCMATALLELDNGSVSKETFLPNCDCLCTTRLLPGEKWEWSIDVDWFWANEPRFGFEPNTGARHRFRFTFYEDQKLTREISSDDVKTNAFRFLHLDPAVQ